MSQSSSTRKRKSPAPGRRRPAKGRRRRRRRRISWPRVALFIGLPLAIIAGLTLHLCSGPAEPAVEDAPESEPQEMRQPETTVPAPSADGGEEAAGTEDSADRLSRLRALLAPAAESVEPEPQTAPDAGCVPLHSRFRGSFGRTFNDSNHVHLGAAVLSGILPVADSESAWRHGRGLVEIRSCPDFYVDRLSHSYPFLTNTGATLLHDIGRRFNDSLAARGGGAYRIKVTSLLRTDHTVGRLRRVNRNATARSAHQYGATFDISYSKFICDDSTATPRRSFEDLKNLLAEIVGDLRDEGRCYVKHERRQACFHITARAVSAAAVPDPEPTETTAHK